MVLKKICVFIFIFLIAGGVFAQTTANSSGEYRSNFDFLMNEGEDLVRRGTLNAYSSYFHAAQKFFEGASLKSPDSDGLLRTERSAFLEIVSDSGRKMQSLEKILSDCQKSYENYIASYTEKNISRTEYSFRDVLDDFERLAEIRNSFLENGKRLDSLNEEVFKRKTGNSNSAESLNSSIYYASHGILGIENRGSTGIIGALDAFWNTRVEDMKRNVYIVLKDQFLEISSVTSNSSFFEKGEYNQIRKTSMNAVQFASHGKKVQSLYDLLSDCEAANFTEYNNSMNFVQKFLDFENGEYGILFSITKSLEENKNSTSSGNSFSQNMAETQTSENLLSNAEFYANLIKSLDSLRDGKSGNLTLEKEKQAVLLEKTLSEKPSGTKISLTAAGIELEDEALSWFEEISSYETLVMRARRECISQSGEIWKNLADVYLMSGEKSLEEFLAQKARADSLLNGEENSKNSKDDAAESVTEKKYYPCEALLIYEVIYSSCTTEKENLENCLKIISDGAQFNDSVVLGKISSVIENFTEIISETEILKKTAEENYRLSQRDLNEAEMNFRRAENSLKRENFDEARRYLESSRQKFISSLLLQENENLRKESDEKLFALDAEISKKQNEIVIAETRKLKDSARNSYYNGNFEDAERSLVRAKTLWELTNVEEDQEILNLMALVNNALSMKTGRVISPSDPLYPEMSQILNSARQYFNEGNELLKNGNRTDGEALLSLSREKLKSLQLVYPLNQEASILSLRIDQIVDPDSFETLFEQRIENARKNYRDAELQNQAYADLLDLHQINPSYRGLSELILSVEYELGIKQKPVEESSKKRSSDIFARAERLYRNARSVSGAKAREEAFKNVISVLDEAISLNPENNEAKRLKDSIFQSEVGGKTQEILSAADEQMYQLAVQEMNRGNIINANSLVESLVAKNGMNKKLRQLNSKIKSLM